jgi:hypothetical protein
VKKKVGPGMLLVKLIVLVTVVEEKIKDVPKDV